MNQLYFNAPRRLVNITGYPNLKKKQTVPSYRAYTNFKQPDPWYKKGLLFQCTGCGKCCSGPPGYIWVTEEDIAAISKHLNISSDEFIKTYTRWIPKKKQYTLIEKPNGKAFDCVFLKEGKHCEVYPHRPMQCRTYPFWEKILESEKSWKDEAQNCEGIGKGDEKQISSRRNS